MFKKIAGIALAAMLIGSTAVVAASAAETDEVVAAADDSAVAAADDSAVGADDASASTGADSKIYFDANSSGWNNYKTITFYLYSKADGEIITWGSKKGNMKDEGNGIWSFDVSSYPIGSNYGCINGIWSFDVSSYPIGSNYGCIFTADWGMQTCDLILGPDSVGDTAQCTGEQVENNVDSNKKSAVVKWKSGKYGNPVCVTSIGNVIGDAYWEGETAYSLFVKFLSSTGADGIDNALKFNGKSAQQTIDDTAAKLGLSTADVEKAIKESGRTFDWKAPAGSDSSSGSGSSSSGSGSSTSGSGSSASSGSSSGSSSSSSGSSSSTSTVTSGEGDTVYFIIGGVMLAAIGVFFLARKRREF